MSPIHWLVGRTLVSVMASALTLLVPLSAVTSGAVSSELAALTLEPNTGSPGTQVKAVASGYANCPPTGNDDVGPGDVAFLWNGEDRLATIPVDNGSAVATFVVPESASLDGHEVVARCLGDESFTASAGFTVTPPVEIPTVVPNIVGLPVDEAADQLENARLALGQIAGEGEVIRSQEPTAGTEVEARTPVDVVLGTVEPVLVVVPDLVESSVDEARSALESVGLRLGSVSGSGDVVRSQSPRAGVEVPTETTVDITVAPRVPELVTVPDLVGLNVDDVPNILVSAGLVLGQISGVGELVLSQNPAAGTRVRSGSEVTVSVEGDVPPPLLVEVPNLVGGTVDDAGAALVAVGLILGNDPPGDGTVESQDPVAGTLIALGSAVTVTVGTSSLWWPAAVGLTVLLGGVLLARRALLARRDSTWVRTHVRAAPGAAPGDAEVVDSRMDGSPPTHAVRIEPHTDIGTQVLEERIR